VTDCEAKAAEIEAAIRREEYGGICTRHVCDCGRGSCRGEKCGQCWREEVARLTDPSGRSRPDAKVKGDVTDG